MKNFILNHLKLVVLLAFALLLGWRAIAVLDWKAVKDPFYLKTLILADIGNEEAQSNLTRLYGMRFSMDRNDGVDMTACQNWLRYWYKRALKSGALEENNALASMIDEEQNNGELITVRSKRCRKR